MATRRPTRADGCPRGEERTAFALGALEFQGPGRGEQREAIARHLLTCAACRAESDADAAVVERLRRFADLEPWEEDVAAADLALAGGRRIRRRAALAGGLAAAAVLASLATASRLVGERSLATPAATAATVSVAIDQRTPSPSTVASLLAAQAVDGRWRAAGAGERHDAGATGLAILALLRADDASLERGAVGRAVANGVRWLTPRLDGDAIDDRDRAVAAAALGQVYERTGERALKTVVARASTRGAARTIDVDPSRALAYIRTH